MMTTTESPDINSVYIDSHGLHESKGEILDRLHCALGTAALKEAEEPGAADAMVVLGGDGSFLHAMRRHDFMDIPVTGINTGTLGFYMDTLPAQSALDAMATSLKLGAFTIRRLPILEVTAGPSHHYAMNEVVIARKSLQAFKASLRLGEGEFEHFVGDGFIFATPQGSTSYGLSAGGPILQEGIEAYIVVPSNPHKSHNYYSLAAPAVVASDTEAVLQVKEVQKRPYIVSADDFVIEDVGDDHEVTVRIARDKKLNMIRFNGHDYFRHVSATFRGKRTVEATE